MTQHITVTAEAPDDIITPTITHYQQLAADFIKAIDQVAAILPKLEEAEIAVAKFTRGRLNVPVQFCATAVASVEQSPELQAVGKLDPVAGHDTLQFLQAFFSVRDKALSFARSVKFAFDSRKASLTSQSLQIYQIAKGLARDKRSPEMQALVANMKRDLDRSGRTKAQRDARKAPKLKPAADEAQQKEVNEA